MHQCFKLFYFKFLKALIKICDAVHSNKTSQNLHHDKHFFLFLNESEWFHDAVSLCSWRRLNSTTFETGINKSEKNVNLLDVCKQIIFSIRMFTFQNQLNFRNKCFASHASNNRRHGKTKFSEFIIKVILETQMEWFLKNKDTRIKMKIAQKNMKNMKITTIEYSECACLQFFNKKWFMSFFLQFFCKLPENLWRVKRMLQCAH